MRNQNYYKDLINEIASGLVFSNKELQNAQISAKRKIKESLLEFDLLERLQKTFLFDDKFLTTLIHNCTPQERAFMVIYLNRLNMFDNSIDLEYLINKKIAENKVQTFKNCIIINGIRYDAKVTKEIQRASNGLLDIDLKPFFYGLSDKELIETSAIFSKLQFLQSDKKVWTKSGFVNMAKDRCVASSFFNATIEWLSKEESFWVSYE